jgi:hypothetical protein
MFAASERDERAWLDYNARFKALSNWNKSAASPFGDGAEDGATFSFGTNNAGFHAQWASLRGGHRGYADPRHPFRHQGSADINTYKMFLEQAHALLRSGGQMGMIVPSGLYTDKGSTDLRKLFIERCRWEWLFGFENRQKVFDIDSRFKFCPVIVRKGGQTAAIRAAFMRHALEDWAEAERFVIPYAREQVTRFSPRTRAILEIREKRDLEVLEKIYANSVLLGDDSPDGWGIKYATEFHMTNDSKLFPPRPWWEERGYVPDEYGRWIKFKGSPNPKKTEPEAGWIRLRDGGGAVAESDIEDVALPLYEGRMIGQFDFSAKGWVSGKGRSAVWREVPWQAKRIEPQYLMSPESYSGATDREGNPKALRGTKLAFMDIASATNERTMIAGVVADFPCGNSAPVLASRGSPALLASCLNSIAYDYPTRARCGGLHLNYFVIDETAIAPLFRLRGTFDGVAAALAIPSPHFPSEWMRLRTKGVCAPWKRLWAISDHERLRLRCILDAAVAELYGIEVRDLAWILRDCDRPGEQFRDRGIYRTLDPKGFWRVDKDKDPELRHTVLTLVAFHDLKQTIRAHGGDREKGIAAFLAQNDGEGWMLPETLCLADYGLGHDDRAKKPQPVRARLGERFLPWQLEQSVEESWKECEIHARNILGEAGFAKLQRELRGEHEAEDAPAKLVAEPAATYGKGSQRRLFPSQRTLFGDEMEDPPPRRRRRR